MVQKEHDMDALGWIQVASILGAGICMGIGAIGPAIGEGRALAQALSSIASSRTRPSPSREHCSWAWPLWNHQ